MACFLGPVAEAVVVEVVEKKEEKKESKDPSKVPMSIKLGWLRNMLLGGAVLLMLEHIWHGEIVASFPFLTAASDLPGMFTEIATVGGGMCLMITIVWIGMCKAADAIMRRKEVAR